MNLLQHLLSRRWSQVCQVFPLSMPGLFPLVLPDPLTSPLSTSSLICWSCQCMHSLHWKISPSLVQVQMESCLHFQMPFFYFTSCLVHPADCVVMPDQVLVSLLSWCLRGSTSRRPSWASFLLPFPWHVFRQPPPHLAIPSNAFQNTILVL